MPNVESLAEAPQSQGRSGAPLTVLLVTVFADLLGFGIVIPFLPIYAERLDRGAPGLATTLEWKRAQGMGMIGAAFGLGFVMGPALGGILGHSSLRAPVFFASALTFANLIFAAMRLPESHRADHSGSLKLTSLVEPVLNLPRQLTRHRLAPTFLPRVLPAFAMSPLYAPFAHIGPAAYRPTPTLPSPY